MIYKAIPSFILFFIFLLLSPTLPGVAAQPSNNNEKNLGAPYAKLSPSMAIIIVVLVAALFFMGFFSIYIRHCSDPNSNNSLRNGILSMHPRRNNAASRGLEQSAIESFPTFSYAEVKDHKVGKGALECAVCLNEFQDDETLRLIPKCDHVFHPECIDAWLESHVTCPVCRANLTPQPEGEGTSGTPELNNQENQENNGEAQRNDDVTIQVGSEDPPERQEAVRPGVNRNFSFDSKRPQRAGSIKRGMGGVFGFGRFRSHSTGHSLVQPGENMERFTLRLPEEKRKEMIDRALLNRAKSYALHNLPRDRSSRRGYRTGAGGGGAGEGSSRGARSYRRIEPLDRAAQSDRWVFSRAPSFFTRALSIRSPRVTADNGGNGGSSSFKGGKTTVKMPSFKCLEPKAADETGLVSADSARPPV